MLFVDGSQLCTIKCTLFGSWFYGRRIGGPGGRMLSERWSSPPPTSSDALCRLHITALTMLRGTRLTYHRTYRLLMPRHTVTGARTRTLQSVRPPCFIWFLCGDIGNGYWRYRVRQTRRMRKHATVTNGAAICLQLCSTVRRVRSVFSSRG